MKGVSSVSCRTSSRMLPKAVARTRSTTAPITWPVSSRTGSAKNTPAAPAAAPTTMPVVKGRPAIASLWYSRKPKLRPSSSRSVEMRTPPAASITITKWMSGLALASASSRCCSTSSPSSLGADSQRESSASPLRPRASLPLSPTSWPRRPAVLWAISSVLRSWVSCSAVFAPRRLYRPVTSIGTSAVTSMATASFIASGQPAGDTVWRSQRRSRAARGTWWPAGVSPSWPCSCWRRASFRPRLDTWSASSLSRHCSTVAGRAAGSSCSAQSMASRKGRP